MGDSEVFGKSKPPDQEPASCMSIPITGGPALEDLPSSMYAAVIKVQTWLHAGARVPLFAMVADSAEAVSQAGCALCHAEGGHYVRLSACVGQRERDNNLRSHWIDAPYLAEVVLELVAACPAPMLIVDDWDTMIGRAKHNDSDAPSTLLRMLAYRPLPKPVVLLLRLGSSGFGSASQIRDVLEAEGRARVVEVPSGVLPDAVCSECKGEKA